RESKSRRRKSRTRAGDENNHGEWPRMVHRCASRSDYSSEKECYTDRISCRKRQFYRHVQVELSRRRTLPTSRARLDKTRRARRGDQVAAPGDRALSKAEEDSSGHSRCRDSTKAHVLFADDAHRHVFDLLLSECKCLKERYSVSKKFIETFCPSSYGYALNISIGTYHIRSLSALHWSNKSDATSEDDELHLAQFHQGGQSRWRHTIDRRG